MHQYTRIQSALARYNIGELWKRTAVGQAHPYAATLTVNVVGSFILGCVAGGVRPGSDGVLLLGTGFCGAFTTFSTYAVDTVKLVEAGKYVPAVLYVVSSNFLSLGAAVSGMRFTSSPGVAAGIGSFMSTHPALGSLFAPTPGSFMAATTLNAGVPPT
jgi:CrcB protein